MEAARGFGKILFLVESGGPGGAERVVLSLAKSYQQSGVSVAVLTFRSGWFTEQLDKENIPRHHIVSHFPFDVTLPFRIARLIRQENIQVLHSHLLDSNFYGGLAARIAGVRHLATEHGDVHHPQSTKMMGFKLRILRALGTKFTAVSRYTAKALASFGVESSAISVVGNPIPTHAASSDGSSRALIRGELGIDESCWVWIHVANLRPVKDQRTLLEGFKLSCALDPKQHLLIVGDGPERAALEAQADSDSRISFLGHRDDVPSLLTASDGFILSSRSEALPMALLGLLIFTFSVLNFRKRVQ